MPAPRLTLFCQAFRRVTTSVLLLICALVPGTACDATEFDVDYAEPVGPTDGTVFDTEDTIILLWDPAPGAASYIVHVSPDAAFAEIIASQRVGITTAEVGPLPKGTYYWRIIALGLGQDEGAISPASVFVVEDQRLLGLDTVYGFDFSGEDLSGIHAEVVSADSTAIRGALLRLGIPSAEIRAILPQTIYVRLEAPQRTLSQIGAIDFLLGDSSGQPTTTAVLDTPPTSRYAPMTIVTDSVVLGAEPQGILHITPAERAAQGTYRMLVELKANVFVVVP